MTSRTDSELWNVAIRPVANNGLGFTVPTIFGEIERIGRPLTLLPDTAATYSEWKRLIVQYGVTDVRIHDARLAAIIIVYRIYRLPTFNTAEFLRYGFEVLHSASI